MTAGSATGTRAGTVQAPTCNERLDRLPATRWHTRMFLMTGLAILFAWSNYVSGLVLAQLSEVGWVTTSNSAVFTAAYMSGMFLGALLGGMVGDAIGRRGGYLLFVGVHTMSMYVAALAPTIEFLICVRAVMGFGLGALLVSLYAGFTEYMPSATRGAWMGRNTFLGNCSGPISSLLVTLITPFVTSDMNWRLMFLIPAILSTLIWLWAFRRYPESPRWLEARGHIEQADEVMARIEHEIQAEYGKPLPPAEHVPGNEQTVHNKVSYRELFHGELLHRVILGAFVLVAMNVTAYTLMSWLPTILLLKGIDIQSSFVLYTVMVLGAPVGACVAMLVMDRVSRKTMGIGLLVIMSVVGLVFAMQTDHVSICVLGFFLQVVVEMYVCFSSGVYVPEIWPTEVRLRGSGLANAIGRISGIITPFVVTFLLDGYGAVPVFVMMAAVALAAALVITKLGIDTRGMSVEDIEARGTAPQEHGIA